MMDFFLAETRKGSVLSKALSACDSLGTLKPGVLCMQSPWIIQETNADKSDFYAGPLMIILHYVVVGSFLSGQKNIRKQIAINIDDQVTLQWLWNMTV